MNRRTAIKQTAMFLGYAVSVSSLSQTFLACHQSVQLDWKPVFLSKEQAALIAAVTETILPQTDTPGAIALGVPQFVDKMLKDLLSEAEQKDFMAGLQQLDADCKKSYSQPFLACSVQQREAFLLKMDQEAATFPPSMWGITLAPSGPPAFYRRLKSLTLLGYFTSQKVGQEILSYDPVPGEFIACMPYKGSNAWTE
jgi:hypothetical protein